jgi:NitT/TauT family transport system substrate-binding protein
MSRTVRIRTFALLALVALVASALVIAGCTSTQTSSTGNTTGTAGSAAAKPAAVRIGVLPTEDSLPLWVAQQKDYFAAAGLPKVEIVNFQSAQERDAAFSAGAVDAYMGDIIAAANNQAGGKKNKIATVMLGADPSQGRFGIAAGPKSGVTELRQLDGVPVGTSSATIQEYVLDNLLAETGMPPSGVKVEEVKKVPVRYELLMADKLKAAALPEPFLTLAETSGAKIIGDDTKSQKNLSQTVLVFSDSYLAKPDGAAAEKAVLSVWDKAVADINADPNAFRALLVEKAKLPAPLANTYKVNTYPTHQLPAEEDVDSVLQWMKDKGYLKADVSYVDLTRTPSGS